MKPGPIENPLNSLALAVALDPRDWCRHRTDAWIYGIVCGWGPALRQVAIVHGWNPKEIARLRRLRVKFNAAHRRELHNLGSHGLQPTDSITET